MPVASLEDISARVGTDLGTSSWIEVDQTAINRFADVTGDHQFIHVDPEAAAATPFGGTVAHGFLTLSLLSQMAAETTLVPSDTKMAVNYGFDKIRFIAPVKSGKRVRGHCHLLSAEEKQAGKWQFVHRVAVEIEGEDKPALTADWIGLIFL
jgi:acyl dehydratase